MNRVVDTVMNFWIGTVNAAEDPSLGGTYFRGLIPLSDNLDIVDIFNLVISWMLFIAGFLAVVYLVYAGILYITAGGDPAKAEKARTGIINAIIGIIIIVLAFVIERTVMNLLD